MSSKEKIIARNRKASFEYFIEKTYEAGLVLKGTEVKSIRQGKVSIAEAYIDIHNMEAFVCGMHINPYEQGNIQNADPVRKRKLLLHKKEIRKLEEGKKLDGYTIIPLALVIRDGLIKMDIGLAKGKKLYDKRQSIKEKEDKRKLDRIMKAR